MEATMATEKTYSVRVLKRWNSSWQSINAACGYSHQGYRTEGYARAAIKRQWNNGIGWQDGQEFAVCEDSTRPTGQRWFAYYRK